MSKAGRSRVEIGYRGGRELCGADCSAHDSSYFSLYKCNASRFKLTCFPMMPMHAIAGEAMENGLDDHESVAACHWNLTKPKLVINAKFAGRVIKVILDGLLRT